MSEVFLSTHLPSTIKEELKEQLYVNNKIKQVPVYERRATYFVVEKFKGEEFEELYKKRCLIIGAKFLLATLKDSLPLPVLNSVKCAVFNDVMCGIVATTSQLTRSMRDQIEKLIGFMGGRITHDYTSAVTHLISENLSSSKASLAKTRGDPIVSPQWIIDCWEAGRLIAHEKYLQQLQINEEIEEVQMHQQPTSTGEEANQQKVNRRSRSPIQGQFSPDIYLSGNSKPPKKVIKCAKVPETTSQPNSHQAFISRSKSPTKATTPAINPIVISPSISPERISPKRSQPASQSPPRPTQLLNQLIQPPNVSEKGPLTGCIIAVSGYSAKQRKNIREIILHLKGTYVTYLDRSITHFLCENPNRKKFKEAKELNIRFCLKGKWLQSCYDQNKRVDESEFIIKEKPSPNKKKEAPPPPWQEIEQANPKMNQKTGVDPGGLFKWKAFFAEGFDEDENSDLEQIVTSYGGQFYKMNEDHRANIPNNQEKYPDCKEFILLVPHGFKHNKEAFNGELMVVSPNWLERCIEEGQLLPPKEHIIFTPLPVPIPYKIINSKNKRICMTGVAGTERRSLRMLIIILGFKYSQALTKNTNILLSSKSKFDIQKINFASSHQIPIVDISWIYSSAKQGKIEDFNEFIIPSSNFPSTPPSPQLPAIFMGVFLFISNRIDPQTREKLQQVSTQLGCSLVDKLTDCVTHIVHQSVKLTDEFPIVKNNPHIKIVSPVWLINSFKEGKLLDEKDYPATLNPNLALQMQDSALVVIGKKRTPSPPPKKSYKKRALNPNVVKNLFAQHEREMYGIDIESKPAVPPVTPYQPPKEFPVYYPYPAPPSAAPCTIPDPNQPTNPLPPQFIYANQPYITTPEGYYLPPHYLQHPNYANYTFAPPYILPDGSLVPVVVKTEDGQETSMDLGATAPQQSTEESNSQGQTNQSQEQTNESQPKEDIDEQSKESKEISNSTMEIEESVKVDLVNTESLTEEGPFSEPKEPVIQTTTSKSGSQSQGEDTETESELEATQPIVASDVIEKMKELEQASATEEKKQNLLILNELEKILQQAALSQSEVMRADYFNVFSPTLEEPKIIGKSDSEEEEEEETDNSEAEDNGESQMVIYRDVTRYRQREFKNKKNVNTEINLNELCKAFNVPKQKSFAFSMLTADEKSTLEKIVLKLGGKIINATDELDKVTHLVTGKLSRSVKMLTSVVAGKWILHPDYLRACGTSNGWVPEEAFEWHPSNVNLKVPDTPLAQVPRFWRKRGELPFLQMRVAVIVDDFKDDLLKILEVGGAQIITKSNTLLDEEIDQITHIFVSDAFIQAPGSRKLLKKFIRKSIACVNATFISALTQFPPPNLADFRVNRKIAKKSE